MFYLIENTSYRPVVLDIFWELEQAMIKRDELIYEIESKGNKPPLYFITEDVRKDRLTYTKMLSDIKNEPKK